MGLCTLSVADFSCTQFGNEWGMAGQDTKITVTSGNLDFVRSVTDNHFLGSHDFELEIIRHFGASNLTAAHHRDTGGREKQNRESLCLSDENGSCGHL